MTALGRPLAVVSELTRCDGPRDHEARIVTDGIRATGYLLRDDTDLGTASTGPGCVEYACPAEDGDCSGILRAYLTGEWTSDPEALDLLTAYGTEVER